MEQFYRYFYTYLNNCFTLEINIIKKGKLTLLKKTSQKFQWFPLQISLQALQTVNF